MFARIYFVAETLEYDWFRYCLEIIKRQGLASGFTRTHTHRTQSYLWIIDDLYMFLVAVFFLSRARQHCTLAHKVENNNETLDENDDDIYTSAPTGDASTAVCSFSSSAAASFPTKTHSVLIFIVI